MFNSYFIHIYPKNIKKNKKTIYCIGKSVTFDSGGMNLKMRNMEMMKFDMIGSAILISVIN
jgi:leucyl aminopeptidase